MLVLMNALAICRWPQLSGAAASVQRRHASLCLPKPTLLCSAGCRSQALLPLFNASSGYLQDKISSSVLASLAAGVPLMVPRRFLEVYQAFKEEHVLLMVSMLWVICFG
jgi:hypothetical protein